MILIQYRRCHDHKHESPPNGVDGCGRRGLLRSLRIVDFIMLESLFYQYSICVAVWGLACPEKNA